MHKMRSYTVLMAVILAGIVAAFLRDQTPSLTGEVNVYTSRKETLIRPLFDQFTEQTGVRVNVVSAEAGALIERLKTEGEHTTADVLLTTDAGNLIRAKEAGLLKPIENIPLSYYIPAHFRDPEGMWYGFSLRSRVIVRAKDRVPADAITTYADLQDEKWRGRVCMRSSNNIYNQSLVASFIAHNGEESAGAWVRDVAKNFARPPQGNDRAQVIDIANGICDVSLVNTYYLGIMLSGNDAKQRHAAEQVAVVFPDQNGNGTHMNISGAGVVEHAKNVKNATALLEFLITEEAQQYYAAVNFEYPVRDTIPAAEIVESWGNFRADTLPMAALGENNTAAIRAFDAGGWE